MNKSFGNIISYLRKEKGITQKQASEDLGISQALLSHYEKGIRECSLEFVVTLAEYYGVSCDYLLGRSAERNYEKENTNQTNNKGLLENLQRKILINNLDFIFEVLTEINQREITKSVTEILMTELYFIIRQLYRNNRENDEEFFTLPLESFSSYCNSFVEKKRGKLIEKIAEIRKSRTTHNKVSLSYTEIKEKYSSSASGVLNLIHATEKNLNKIN